MSRRPNRWESARDPYAASQRVSPLHTAAPIRTWSMPLMRVLRGLFWLVVAAACFAYLSDVIAGVMA